LALGIIRGSERENVLLHDMSGYRRRYQDRQLESTDEGSFENIEPADFRLPSPQEELIDSSSAEPLVQHLAQDNSADRRGTRTGESVDRREYYSQSRQYPAQHDRHDRRFLEYQYRDRREGARTDTARVDSAEQEASDTYRRFPAYRYRDRHGVAHADSSAGSTEREAFDAHLINQVSSSAGESVGSQRHWPPHDEHSFDSQQPADPSIHYNASSRYPASSSQRAYPQATPSQRVYPQVTPVTTGASYYRTEEYRGPSRYPYSMHATHFRPVEHVQQGEPKSSEIIEEINENDVICGRGGAANTHIGNRSFREFVKKHQARYLKSKKKDKPEVAEFIVNYIKKLTPPGRFVKKDQLTGLWHEVSSDRAREKASQALREGAAAKRREQERELGNLQRSSSPTSKSDLSDSSEEEKEESAKEQEHKETSAALQDTKGAGRSVQRASEHRKSESSLDQQEGDGTAVDVEHGPDHAKDDGSSCSASSTVSSIDRANYKRVVVIRPALDLRRHELVPVNVEALSEEEKNVYLESFAPPPFSPSRRLPLSQIQ